MGIRTPDLYVANVSRYQLCYIPVNVKQRKFCALISLTLSGGGNKWVLWYLRFRASGRPHFPLTLTGGGNKWARTIDLLHVKQAL